MRKVVRYLAAVVAVGMALVVASSALATPIIGLTPTILGAGSVSDPTQVKLKQGAGFAEPRDVDQVVTAKFELAPGGTFGWHRHPGPVVVVVTQGTLSVVMAEGCMEHEYSAGEAFIESGREVHIANNEGSTPVILYATFLLPDGAAPRIDEPAADC